MDYRKDLLCGAALMAAIFVPAGQAAAQDATPAEAGTGQHGAGIEDIVVTARRTSERLQDVPIAITAVGQQQLRELTVRDIMDVQKLAPGLYINSQGNAGRAKLSIRGQAEADSVLTTDPSVGVYVDGANLPRSLGLRSAFLDIAQVEVLKGPQGTLFGRNTTGGALNITTRQPTYETGGFVDVLLGNYANRQFLAAVNLPLVEGKLAIRLVGQTIDRKGYGHDALGEARGNDHVDTARLHILIEPSEKVRLLLSGDYTRQRNGFTPTRLIFNNMATCCNSATSSLGQIASELGLNPASAADRATALAAFSAEYNRYYDGSLGRYDSLSDFHSFDKFDQGGVSGTLSVDMDWASIKSITAYRELHRDTLQDLDGTSFDIVAARLRTKENNFSQELQLSGIDGHGFDWQVGAYYNVEKGTDGGDSATNPRVAVVAGSLAGGNQFAGQLSNLTISQSDIRNESMAVYGQVVVPLFDTVRFTGGLRYTREKRDMDNQNSVDRTTAILGQTPLPFVTPGNCALLDPDYGGPVFPDCHKQVSVKFNAVTYLASLDWKPTDDIMLFASTARGFRAGGWTLRANGNLITAATRDAAQALEAATFKPFSPEYVTNYEFGFKTDLFDRHLRLNGAAFYQKYDDIQVNVRIAEGTAIANRIVNAAKGTIYGGELEASAVLTDRFRLDGGIAYLRARYDEFLDRTSSGAVIDRSAQRFPAPTWTWHVGGSYTLPLGDGQELRFAANYNWIDDVNFRPDVTLAALQNAAITQKAYGLLDARITWSLADEGLEVSLWGRNLANKDYMTSVQQLISTGLALSYQGDPRTFGIQIRKTFGGG